MDYMINFPNLGIFLEHVGKNITLFGDFTIAYYGIVIAIGMMLGLGAATRRAAATGQDPDTYYDIVLVTLFVGVIGARIYYVVFSWDAYKNDLMSIFNIRQGGLAIYGGLIFGTITLVAFSKIKKIKAGAILDTVIMGVPIGQILGRWGNFFNREAFGGYTDNLFAMQLPVSAVRQNEITEEMWANLQVIDGIEFIQVHPTFLYEGLWNTGVLIFLFLYRNRTRYNGQLFIYYLAGYGLGRFFVESLRTDQLLLMGTQIPVSQLLSAVLVAGCLVLNLILRKRFAGREDLNLLRTQSGK